MTEEKPISRADLRTTTNPSAQDIDTFLDLLSTSYLHVPLTTSFISEIDSIPAPYPSDSISAARVKSHFSLGISAVAKSNVLLTFAYPSSSTTHATSHASEAPLAAALFEPPSFTGIPPSHARKSPGPLLTNYRNLARSLKTKHLSIPESGPNSWAQPAAPSQASAGPSEDPYPGDFNKDSGAEVRAFYHLSFLARNADADPKEVDNAMRELVADYQGKAGAETVPIWLLISTEAWMEEFQSMGFRVVEEARVGDGQVDEQGWPSKGRKASGVRIWAMLWEP